MNLWELMLSKTKTKRNVSNDDKKKSSVEQYKTKANPRIYITVQCVVDLFLKGAMYSGLSTKKEKKYACILS